MRTVFTRQRGFRCMILLLTLLCLAPAVQAATPPPLGPIPAEAAGPVIDPLEATHAYLATVPAAAHARSDAYFEGGYWLILWNVLLSSAILLLLLHTGWSAAWSDRVAAISNRPSSRVALYACIYNLVFYVLTFPLNFYQDFFREHQYGMATQNFAQWFGQQMIGLLVSTFFFGLLLAALYAVFRRAPRTWWLWGSAVMVAFVVIGIAIAPAVIEPLFNKYTPLQDPALRDPILAMARANQIPVTNVYVVDASRQTKRVSANVSGILGSARIALNDNLVSRCSLPEIRQVMAHEMGHYVLNHIYKIVWQLAGVVLVGFALSKVIFEAAVARYGTRWRVDGIADVAGFPLLALILSVLGFLYTPIGNSLAREIEAEADSFGINTSREPDGFAQSALKLGEYRKLDPGPLEEIIFFDHPSGRARIMKAMEWKAAHLPAGGG